MSLPTAQSTEIPLPPGPPRPPEVPPQPVPFPPPHVPVMPPPTIGVRVAVPQVPMPRPTWAYKHLTRDADAPALDEAELNALGRDGWELIGVVPSGRVIHYYFKREDTPSSW